MSVSALHTPAFAYNATTYDTLAYSTLDLWKKIKQNTKEWLIERSKMITASDVPAILEMSPFATKQEIFQKKIHLDLQANANENSEPALLWGKTCEKHALRFYENSLFPSSSYKLHQVGLIHHKMYPWLGASPDGGYWKSNVLITEK
jgi:putative phage-type endonuclease